MLTATLHTLLAGALATAAMSLTMWAIHRSGASKADMIRALGSLLTKKTENALFPGIVTHFLSGLMFAFPYAILVNALSLNAWWALGLAGMVLGLFHGFIVGFLLVAFVAESHPLEAYRDVGVSVAVAHVMGHVVYGAIVGLCCAVLTIRWELLRLAPVGS